MILRLQFAPTPEWAPKLAEFAVNAAREVDGVTLDYSVASLGLVDQIIGRFYRDGLTAEQMGDAIFSLGCYVGEVLVRNNSGRWKYSDPSLSKELGLPGLSIVVQLPNSTIWNPVGKAFKLLANGSVDSVSYFYTVATKDA